MFRFATIMSGGGTTATEAYLATKPGGVLHGKAELAAAISTDEDAGCLPRLMNAGFRHSLFTQNPKMYDGDLEVWGKHVREIIRVNHIQLVCLFGCLVQIPESLILWCRSQGILMINQHPGWAPWFGGKYMYGLRVVAAQMIYATLRELPTFQIGAISQEVDPEMDRGAILNFGSISFVPSPKARAANIQARLLPVEHSVQINTILQAAEGRLYKIENPFQPTASDLPIIEQANKLAIMCC